jgi:hypothetical protein
MNTVKIMADASQFLVEKKLGDALISTNFWKINKVWQVT